MKAVQRDRPNPDLAKLLDFVGTAKDILLVGDPGEELLGILDARGCTLACVLVGEASADEARVYSLMVEVAPADSVELPEAFQPSSFDIVIIDGAIERFHEPWRILAESRQFLRSNGFVIALLPNASHGAIRLALIKGILHSGYLESFDHPYSRGFTPKGVHALFLRAGFRIERAEHIRRPIFGSTSGLPNLDRSDFSRAVVDEVLADPDSEIFQFVVKASLADSDVAEERGTRKAPDRAEPEHLPSRVYTIASAQVDIPQILDPDAMLDLRNELAAEREANAALKAAVEHTIQAAAALEMRIDRMAARRKQFEDFRAKTKFDEARQKVVVEARTRLAERLQAELEKTRMEIAGLKARAVQTELKITDLERQISTGSIYARGLEREIAAKQLQIEEGAAYVLRIEGALQAAEAAAHAHQLAFHEQTDRLDAARKTALAERIVMRDYAEEIRRDGAARASAYETRLDGLTVELLRAVEQLREYEAQLGESQRNVASATAERDELRERVADTERLLLDQSESVMATMQSESAQLALLIDTVQSSRFWKFKRWLSRLRPRSRVRVPR